LFEFYIQRAVKLEKINKMSEGISPVNISETLYQNAYTPKIKKHAAHYAKAQKVIQSRMKSAKQLEEQAIDYSITATKLRNKYLNELFDYVADVHKAEIKKGKRHHSVSNYDVLELYQKINGYNEKDFCRMLRATTPEGERAYSFKEINKMLDDSIIEHFRAIREQQAAAKTSRVARRPESVTTTTPLASSAENQVFSTGVIPRERALTVIRKTEKPLNQPLGISMDKILESAHAVMNPTANTLSFCDITPIEIIEPPQIGLLESEKIVNASENAAAEILTGTEELVKDNKKGPSEIIDKAKEVVENIEEGINNADTKTRRLSKGWTAIIIATVALITGIVIHKHNKNKAKNLNATA